MAITGEAGFPYTVAEFAAKHSLCLQQADIVLRANKKSREQADQGAVIFKQMMAARSERVQTNGAVVFRQETRTSFDGGSLKRRCAPTSSATPAWT